MVVGIAWVVLGRGGDDSAANPDTESAASSSARSDDGGVSATAADDTGDGGSAAGSTDGSKPAKPASTPRLTADTLAQLPKDLAVRRAGNTKLVALTFDDGPSDYTLQVAKVLEQYGVHGTFFMLGTNVEGREDIVRTLVAHGHAIGNHSWSHPDLTTLAPADRKSQLRDTLLTLRRVVGDDVPLQLFRPPYGAMNADVNTMARKLGLVPIEWDVDSEDYQAGSTPREIAERVLGEVEGGSILLFHDGGGKRTATIKALPLVLDVLRNRGLKPVTVLELLNSAPPASSDANAFLASMGGAAN